MSPAASARRTAMTDQPTTDRTADNGPAPTGQGPADRPADPAATAFADPARAGDRPAHYPSREMLDRELRAIKDEVLRMGSLVAAQIGVAIDALVPHDADKPPE